MYNTEWVCWVNYRLNLNTYNLALHCTKCNLYSRLYCNLYPRVRFSHWMTWNWIQTKSSWSVILCQVDLDQTDQELLSGEKKGCHLFLSALSLTREVPRGRTKEGKRCSTGKWLQVQVLLTQTSWHSESNSICWSSGQSPLVNLINQPVQSGQKRQNVWPGWKRGFEIISFLLFFTCQGYGKRKNRRGRCNLKV